LRAHHLAALKEMIDDTDKLSPTKRAELVGVISTKPHLKRYLRTTPSGLLRIDAAAIAREANLDGKYLLRTSDPTLSAEDVAGLQTAAGGRPRLAGTEDDPGPAPGLSPPRRPHPLPHPAVLARAAAHPHRRNLHRADLAGAAP
jgi:hypothetical protein